MKTAVKSLVCSALGFILTICFAGAAAAQGPVDTNRLETGGSYQIAPPPTNMMFKITNNDTNAGAGDDNLIWSNSGRMLAVDRSDPNAAGPGGNKNITLLDVRNLGNVQTIGARSSAVTNPLFANITGWTWNDDRVLFGWQLRPQSAPPGKVRLMSCTTTGDVSVVPFLAADPQANPTNHVYSPSVVLDPAINQERLLCLVSSSTNDNEAGPTDVSTQPAARINLFTVPFDSGGVPSWNERVQLTAFNTNLSITSAKWCPELGTNYEPIANRIVILFSSPPGSPAVGPPAENNKIVVFNDVQGVIANPATAPTSLADDPRFVVVETNLTMNSQVSWTFDGQYVMYGRMGTNLPPAPVSSDLYSMRADSSTNTAVKFETPSSISGGNKQWLSISPDGMKAAFTVDKQVYVIPLQFDNVAVTGAVVTNVLTDASYTAVDVSGDAIPSNTVFSIVAPPSVDTNNFIGEFSGFARQFSVSGVSSQFDLATNAEMTLHFSEADIPSGASVTNLAVYVYNPEGSGGQTGTWDKLDSVIDTNKQTISAEVQHFSIYAIGRASAAAQPVTPAGPTIEANGQADSITVSASDAVTITVAMNVATYPTDVPVDWWVVASANLSGWYYLNSALQWTEALFSGDFTVFQPVHQGPLFNLPSTTVLPAMTLPPGTYYFWFAVDYPMDGILNPDGPILYNRVTVVVQ